MKYVINEIVSLMITMVTVLCGHLQGEGRLGDIEPSSHSDGAPTTPPSTSRPNTRYTLT